MLSRCLEVCLAVLGRTCLELGGVCPARRDGPPRPCAPCAPGGQGSLHPFAPWAPSGEGPGARRCALTCVRSRARQ
eukprot:8549501-Alexandrium_andersonii.AAC.1